MLAQAKVARGAYVAEVEVEEDHSLGKEDTHKAVWGDNLAEEADMDMGSLLLRDKPRPEEDPPSRLESLQTFDSDQIGVTSPRGSDLNGGKARSRGENEEEGRLREGGRSIRSGW
jgi:hypothetical protein